jgi:hypothetical protein
VRTSLLNKNACVQVISFGTVLENVSASAQQFEQNKQHLLDVRSPVKNFVSALPPASQGQQLVAPRPLLPTGYAQVTAISSPAGL